MRSWNSGSFIAQGARMLPSTSSVRTSGSTWQRSAAMPRPRAIAWRSLARCRSVRSPRPSGRRGSGWPDTDARVRRHSATKEQRKHALPGLLGRLADRLTRRLGLLLHALVGLLHVFVGPFGKVDHGFRLALGRRLALRCLTCLRFGDRWFGDAAGLLRGPRHPLDRTIAVKDRAALDTTAGMPAVTGHRRQTEPRQGLASGAGILNDAAVDGVGLRAGNAVFLGESHPAPAQARTEPDAHSDEWPGCRRDGDVYLALHVCLRASPENAAFPGSWILPPAAAAHHLERSPALDPTGNPGNTGVSQALAAKPVAPDAALSEPLAAAKARAPNGAHQAQKRLSPPRGHYPTPGGRSRGATPEWHREARADARNKAWRRLPLRAPGRPRPTPDVRGSMRAARRASALQKR